MTEEEKEAKREAVNDRLGDSIATEPGTSLSTNYWSTVQVGPTAYVRVRSIPPSIMEKMPSSTTIFTNVNTIELITLYLKGLQASITGKPKAYSHALEDSEPNSQSQSGD